MFSDTRINYELFDIASELEQIERQMIQLQMRKDALLEKQSKLKQKLVDVQSDIEFDNWKLAQDMAFELLNEKLVE